MVESAERASGFTPAAWDKWDGYNPLGQAALVLFLFITHFLVVTILITVLTNSFMAIVQNANDEHQYVFAVNTISMVKSDALFSYIAPANIIAWLLTPLRSCLPFRQYVKLNRTTIKFTHFPLLFGICAYERLFLKQSIYDSTDHMEQRGRDNSQLHAFNTKGANNLFSPNPPRHRERSVATHQDRALDAVFHRPLRHQDSAITHGTGRTSSRRPKTENIDTWFSKMGPENPASPPAEQDRKVVDRLERPRTMQRRVTPKRRERRNFSVTSMSIASDPEDFRSLSVERPPRILEEAEWLDAPIDDSIQLAGEDGDDELVTHDEHENEEMSLNSKVLDGPTNEAQDYFHLKTPVESRTPQPIAPLSQTPEDRVISFAQTTPPSQIRPNTPRTRRPHQRNLSTNTILYNPVVNTSAPSSAGRTAVRLAENEKPRPRRITPPNEKQNASSPTARSKPPKRMRPVMPDRKAFQSAPNLAGLLMFDDPQDRYRNREASSSIRRAPSYHMDLVSDLGDNKAVGGHFVGALPASYAAHMGFMGAGEDGVGGSNHPRRRQAPSQDSEDQTRMGKLVLARMNNLEDSFREVLKEVKHWRRGSADGKSTPASGIGAGAGAGAGSASGASVVPTTPGRRRTRGGSGGGGGERERERERDGKLGKKRREGEWVEESGSASEVRAPQQLQQQQLKLGEEEEAKGSSI